MLNDEQAIRQWFESRMHATKEGDLQLARSLIAGHSLSILKRQGDAWVVIRDANTMAAVNSN